MAGEEQIDIASIAMSAVVIIGMLYAASKMMPMFLAALYQLLPAIIMLWFIVIILRGIVKNLLG